MHGIMMQHSSLGSAIRRPQVRARLCVHASAAAPQTTQDLKRALLQAVGPTQRGRRSTPEQRKQIMDLVLALEGANPTKRPVESGKLSARWSLLYQAPVDESDAARANPDTTLEGPVLARLRPLFGGLVKSKGITQVIEQEAGKVENIAEFSLLNGVADGYLNIRGTCAVTADDKDAVQVDVEFKDFVVKLGALMLTIPLGWAKPQGWVRTTYVDDEMRIGRGDKGSVFVTAKQK